MFAGEDRFTDLMKCSWKQFRLEYKTDSYYWIIWNPAILYIHIIHT